MKNQKMYEADDKISVPTLLHYLEASHAYFLDFLLPYIRRELTESLNEKDHLARLILRFYDEYARKLQIHSPAGLTIYAIVNGLVDISAVKI